MKKFRNLENYQVLDAIRNYDNWIEIRKALGLASNPNTTRRLKEFAELHDIYPGMNKDLKLGQLVRSFFESGV